MIDRNTILIIDDDQDEALLTKYLLSEIDPGVDLEWAPSGEKGLERLRGNAPLPRMVLLDLKMAGISGIDTLSQLRADDRLRHLPVIAITNSTLESDEQQAMAAGADAFLHKAFDMEKFSTEIKLQLDRFTVR